MATTFSDAPSNAAPPPAGGESPIDLRAYWRVVMRRRWVILGTFIAAMIVTGVHTVRQQRIYGATATLVIDTVAPKVLGNAQVQDVADTAQPFWVSKEYYETQYTVMKSRVVAERVARKVATARDDRFLSLDAVPSEEARAAGLKALTELRARLSATSDPGGVMLGRLAVEPVKESRVVRLIVEDPDPVLAAGLANAFAQAYMEHNLAAKTATTETASESLETQLPDLESKLQRSSTELSEFKNAHDIISSGWEDKQNTVSLRVSRINDELTNVRLKKAALKARYDAVVAVEKDVDANDAARIALIPAALAEAINTLKKKVMDLRFECSELEERLLEKHPKYISCKQRLTVAERSLKSEIDAALFTARSEYNDIVATEKYLVTDLNQAKAEAQLANKYEPEYLKLRRAHEFNLKLYDVALRSLKETSLSGSTRLNNVSMLDAARAAASPSKPKVRELMLMGALIGLLLGLGFALGLEFLDNTVNGQEQIEQGLALTFLGIVPSIDERAVGSRDLVVAEQPKSAVAECCRGT
ncbi:MAG: hypothetical protein JNK82_30755, partial [Myxococcaceae bacterium]|nr:hypothetical protein [Myxococcaceae bacterium]